MLRISSARGVGVASNGQLGSNGGLGARAEWFGGENPADVQGVGGFSGMAGADKARGGMVRGQTALTHACRCAWSNACLCSVPQGQVQGGGMVPQGQAFTAQHNSFGGPFQQYQGVRALSDRPRNRVASAPVHTRAQRPNSESVGLGRGARRKPGASHGRGSSMKARPYVVAVVRAPPSLGALPSLLKYRLRACAGLLRGGRIWGRIRVSARSGRGLWRAGLWRAGPGTARGAGRFCIIWCSVQQPAPAAAVRGAVCCAGAGCTEGAD